MYLSNVDNIDSYYLYVYYLNIMVGRVLLLMMNLIDDCDDL